MPENRVSPEPVVVGMANQLGTPRGSTQDAWIGAEAAVAYINEDLGGIDGHPLKIEARITNGTAESSIACAEELIALKPVAFIGGADQHGYATAEMYGASGIPVVGGPIYHDAEYVAPNTYKFAPSHVTNWPAMIAHATDGLGADRIALIYPDNAPGTMAANNVLEPVIKNKNKACLRVPYAPHWSPAAYQVAVEAALTLQPDAVIAIGPTSACRGLLAAVKTSPGGNELPFFASTIYIDPSTLEEIGEANLNEVYTVSAFDSWGDGDQPRAYRRAIKRYVYRDELDEVGVAAFSTVMNLYAVLTDLGADNISPGTIAGRLQASRETSSFMGHPYSWNEGTNVPGRPALCDNHTRVVKIHPDLTREFVTDWVDHGDLLPPPAQAPRSRAGV